jgi:hypothetical protein
MATLSGTTAVSMNLVYQGATSIEGSLDTVVINRKDAIVYANGTGSGQANVLFRNRLSVSSGGGSGSIDFNALLDPYGTTNNWAKIKRFKVFNENTVAGDDVILSGDIFGAWGNAADTFTLRARGTWYVEAPVDGYTVTATTQDVLTYTNNGSNAVTLYFEGIGNT